MLNEPCYLFFNNNSKRRCHARICVHPDIVYAICLPLNRVSVVSDITSLYEQRRCAALDAHPYWATSLSRRFSQRLRSHPNPILLEDARLVTSNNRQIRVHHKTPEVLSGNLVFAPRSPYLGAATELLESVVIDLHLLYTADRSRRRVSHRCTALCCTQKRHIRCHFERTMSNLLGIPTTSRRR